MVRAWILVLAAGFALAASPAAAQATRTWVSGLGDDANPCSRTEPCKTFAGAISKTAAGGEISVLDSGGFGAVTITKSISIVNAGAEGSILAAQTNGVIVNAGPTDVVLLRGLTMDGAGTGTNGVRFIAGGSLLIEDSLIRNFRAPAANGIQFAPTGASELTIVGTTIADNVSAGIAIQPAATGKANVTLDGVRLVNNDVGLSASGAGTQVWVGDSLITGNNNAVAASGGAVVRSFGDNRLAGNTSDGTVMAPAAKK